MRNHLIVSGTFLVLIGSLQISCLGPSVLERTHLRYNEAVCSVKSDELLLNLVRARYMDRLEVLTISSLTSQVTFSATAGATFGEDQELDSYLGNVGVGYSNTPTLSFAPMRSVMARTMLDPVQVTALGALVSGGSEIETVFRLLVEYLNGLTNEPGHVGDFVHAARRMQELAAERKLTFGHVQLDEPLALPVSVSSVSMEDQIQAAQAGYRMRAASEGKVVLTGTRTESVCYIDKGSDAATELLEMLQLDETAESYPLRPTERLAKPSETGRALAVRLRSLAEMVSFVAQGIEVPKEHIERGVTYAVPGVEPGRPSPGVEDLFRVRVSESKPRDTSLLVAYRGYWFYIPYSEHRSRKTFALLVQLLRLAETETGEPRGPILTLPLK